MQLDWLKPLTGIEGPFACATLDASNLDPVTRSRRLAAWGSARRELERRGADGDTLAVLEEAVTDPTGAAERTRVVCASHGHLVLDVGMDGRPRHESSSFGPVPRLMEVVRGLDGKETHAVVRLDREGADIKVIDPSGAIVTATDVTGDHDELRKVGVGGASQRRFQARAEDSWKHNANQIAAELDRLVRRLRLGVVFLEGEEHMASCLLEQASGPTAELLVRLDTGGRAAGTFGDGGGDRPGCGAGSAARRARRSPPRAVRRREGRRLDRGGLGCRDRGGRQGTGRPRPAPFRRLGR